MSASLFCKIGLEYQSELLSQSCVNFIKRIWSRLSKMKLRMIFIFSTLWFLVWIIRYLRWHQRILFSQNEIIQIELLFLMKSSQKILRSRAKNFIQNKIFIYNSSTAKVKIRYRNRFLTRINVTCMSTFFQLQKTIILHQTNKRMLL